MLFNSVSFLLFLPIVFLLYWFVTNRNLKWQNALIVGASYIFYGWWDWRFLLLIAFTTLCSYFSGTIILRLRTKQNDKDKNPLSIKWITIANILINLLILGFFKYFNFFITSFVELFSMFGITLHASTLKIILPVGISFYTFQALSYTIDVYRKKIEPTSDLLAFFAFISFFPQLVAGPIERATQLLPQFQQKRHFDYHKAADGCRQMLWGFFKKIAIADTCAIYVNEVFANYSSANGSTLLIAAVLFSFQIYGDFSGYSDIAIGCAKLFGIKLMRNFNVPYFSRDIAEFWRRWHISLTTWFRDYIYIPLGGSRTTKAKIVRNTFIIFLVSGFWHGANWTFIAWGGYHALLFLPLILLGKNRKYTDVVATQQLADGTTKRKYIPNIKEILQMLFTFVFVVIGWIIFRSENITQAFDYLAGMLSFNTLKASYRFFINSNVAISAWLIVFMLIVEWLQRDKPHALTLNPNTHTCIRYAIYAIMLFLLIFFYGKNETFIYFQF